MHCVDDPRAGWMEQSVTDANIGARPYVAAHGFGRFLDFRPSRRRHSKDIVLEGRERPRPTLLRLKHTGPGFQHFSFRYNPNPHLLGHINEDRIPLDARLALLWYACDHLLVYHGQNGISPVYLRIANGPRFFATGRELEEIFCCLPIFHYHRSIFDVVLNGNEAVEQPRFVLAVTTELGNPPLAHARSIHRHRKHPRVFSFSPTRTAGYSLAHYGNSNKIIKVAVAATGKNGVLDSRDLFKVLASPDPNPAIAATMK